MTAKEQLLDYLENLTPADIRKLWEHREEIEKEFQRLKGGEQK